MSLLPSSTHFFFFNDPATTQIYTLSLHDALPISTLIPTIAVYMTGEAVTQSGGNMMKTFLLLAVSSVVTANNRKDRKSTRLNSSHTVISYAVFCLKKKT